VCRTLLPVGKEIPVTAALCQILQSSFPEEYEARRQEERAQFSGQEGEGEEQPLPLFVMTSIFPGKFETREVIVMLSYVGLPAAVGGRCCHDLRGWP